VTAASLAVAGVAVAVGVGVVSTQPSGATPSRCGGEAAAAEAVLWRSPSWPAYFKGVADVAFSGGCQVHTVDRRLPVNAELDDAYATFVGGTDGEAIYATFVEKRLNDWCNIGACYRVVLS
jgi:hypothetical protein